jgi:hypothetical protein
MQEIRSSQSILGLEFMQGVTDTLPIPEQVKDFKERHTWVIDMIQERILENSMFFEGRPND